MRRYLYTIGLIYTGLLFPCNLQAASLSFDGNDKSFPIKSDNISLVKGLSGSAIHLNKDSFLEYSVNPQDFLTPTSGTFMLWFRHDYTIPSCYQWRDRDKDENGDISFILQSGVYNRYLFTSGHAKIFGGIACSANIGAIQSPVKYWSRRILDGEWHFLAMSYDTTRGKVIWHADGLTMQTNAVSSKARFPLGKTFTLGSGIGRLALEGAIDEVKFMPVALGKDDFRKEYLKYQPIRYELHDWTVEEGETKAFRFRARNESATAVKKALEFSNNSSFELSLEPNEVKEFTIDVKGEKPGLFKLFINEGEADARQFECICLSKEKKKNIQSEQKTLIGEYDCTKTYPNDRVALCASEVVTNGTLVYLESRDYRTAIPLSAYRFKIGNQGKPHIVELDYPDDKIRSFVVGIYAEKWGRIHTKTIDSAGIMTGIDYPLSMKMQTKQIVFWPDSETVSVVVQNYLNRGGGWKMEPTSRGYFGEYPASCAAVRIYELNTLVPGPVQGMSDKKRSVAQWDEDPTIDANLTFSQAFNYDRADLEFWRIKWQRTIDYMRWNSMDSWIIKVVNYNGDATHMDATLPEAALPWNSLSYENGRCRGWAELGADMLTRSGMGFWVRINHRIRDGWFTRLGGDSTGSSSNPDIRNPAMRNAYLRLVAAYRDKFSRYPGFRGITLNEALPVYFPGGERETVDFARELVQTLRAKGGNGEIQLWIEATGFGGAKHNDSGVKWEDWDGERCLLSSGVNLKELAKIPGLRVVPCPRPDIFRTRLGSAKNGKASMDEPYFMDSPSWIRLMRENRIDCFNVVRQSNFEIYPKYGIWEDSVNAWKTELWLPPFNVVTGTKDFQSYPTPHAGAPYTLDAVTSLIADYDIQDFLTGFWGIVESGEHDEWRRFYGEFRQIPRGDYALAKGANDPVCIRSGKEGHYLVNREPYPVKVEYTVDGKEKTLMLEHHEIRFVKDEGINGAVEMKNTAIPDSERAIHIARLEKLESAAKAKKENTTLARAAKEARTAFEEGRFRQFRALFLLGEVRRVFNPEVFPVK